MGRLLESVEIQEENPLIKELIFDEVF